MMKAEIIAVVRNFLDAGPMDTNSLPAEELNKLGIEVVRRRMWRRPRIADRGVRDALNRVPLIISSGGLGPTEDDLTRETYADLLGRN